MTTERDELKRLTHDIPVTVDGIGAHLVHDNLQVSSRVLLVAQRPSLTNASHRSSIPGALVHSNTAQPLHLVRLLYYIIFIILYYINYINYIN